jgi:hypothetical protein
VTKAQSNWNEWFTVERTVSPDELSFVARNGVIVVMLREDPRSKSIIRNLSYAAIFLVFAVIGILCIEPIWMQVTWLCLVLIGLCAFTARTRISIETSSMCLIAETLHFGRITHRSRIRFQNDASFIARPVGGYQNIENELVFADRTQSHFCLYVTNPNDFDYLLRDLNAAVCNPVATIAAHSQPPSL